jgi:hypothetical protein
MGFTRTRSLESEALAETDQIPHPLDHPPAGLESYSLYIARCNLPRNLIGIQQGVNSEFAR